MSFTSGSMRGGRNRKFKSEINVVPYIDVMMVLLVIFMVTAPMVNPSEIELPNAAKSTLPPTEYIRIDLKADASATVSVQGKKGGAKPGETVATRGELGKKLQTLVADNPDIAVMIAADKNIKYDEVIQAISEAKKLGISRVGLATK
ncbi:Putative biopolymer transport protein [Herminiimonas arsenicoxydans]|uniref:Biopolymer transport protein n=1 Tax=Herminiimonas arsenicoxydans TaxID=204773 RepID=A4G7P9_HERAR|nr:Putative biopolymer transport protein [Herminiimonas arsenicoxydans]